MFPCTAGATRRQTGGLAVEAYADAGGAVLIRSTANIAVGRKPD